MFILFGTREADCFREVAAYTSLVPSSYFHSNFRAEVGMEIGTGYKASLYNTVTILDRFHCTSNWYAMVYIVTDLLHYSVLYSAVYQTWACLGSRSSLPSSTRLRRPFWPWVARRLLYFKGMIAV